MLTKQHPIPDRICPLPPTTLHWLDPIGSAVLLDVFRRQLYLLFLSLTTPRWLDPTGSAVLLDVFHRQTTGLVPALLKPGNIVVHLDVSDVSFFHLLRKSLIVKASFGGGLHHSFRIRKSGICLFIKPKQCKSRSSNFHPSAPIFAVAMGCGGGLQPVSTLGHAADQPSNVGARNIKNRAVVKEKEDRWDDIEWLQAAMVTSLEKRELGGKHWGNSAGAIGGTAKYEEILGPGVIEEYEKTIVAMEAELNLNRAAPRHTNEMAEENEEESTTIAERHATTELYVEELRAHVAKLTEREASTEAYVCDLEEKMKTCDETSITSSERMSDLKREVARFKDSESHSTKYIADLEAHLAHSDELILALQQTVENLEREVNRCRDKVESLQTWLSMENVNSYFIVDLPDSESERNDSSVISESDESLEHLNELMLSMAQKESHHREVVDAWNEQLTQLRRQHDELMTLSRDQALNISSEIENLRSQYNWDLRTWMSRHLPPSAMSLWQLPSCLNGCIGIMRLPLAHSRRSMIRNFGLAYKKSMRFYHRPRTSMKWQFSSSVLHKTEDYYNVMTKLCEDHAAAMGKQSTDAAAALEHLKEVHAGELRMAEIARKGSLSKSQSCAIALQGLREEHSATMSRKQASFAEEMELLKSEHARALEGVCMKLKEEWRVEGERLNSTIIAIKEEAASSASVAAAKASAELEVVVKLVQEQQATVLQEIKCGLEAKVSRLNAAHSSALEDFETQAADKHAAIVQSHMEGILKNLLPSSMRGSWPSMNFGQNA
ncbi:hypothetical protein IW262DRAFT_1463289 [Armillaria fumosa]|nr:hypothetical protein IW262DRAFT_1463289 [Armillaria fumosa]